MHRRARTKADKTAKREKEEDRVRRTHASSSGEEAKIVDEFRQDKKDVRRRGIGSNLACSPPTGARCTTNSNAFLGAGQP